MSNFSKEDFDKFIEQYRSDQQELEQAKERIEQLEKENRNLQKELLHVSEIGAHGSNLHLDLAMLLSSKPAVEAGVLALRRQDTSESILASIQDLINSSINSKHLLSEIEHVLEDRPKPWHTEWEGVEVLTRVKMLLENREGLVRHINEYGSKNLDEVFSILETITTVCTTNNPLIDTLRKVAQEYKDRSAKLAQIWDSLYLASEFHLVSDNLAENVESLVQRFNELAKWKEEAAQVLHEQHEAAKGLPTRFLGMSFSKALVQLWKDNQELEEKLSTVEWEYEILRERIGDITYEQLQGLERLIGALEEQFDFFCEEESKGLTIYEAMELLVRHFGDSYGPADTLDRIRASLEELPNISFPFDLEAWSIGDAEDKIEYLYHIIYKMDEELANHPGLKIQQIDAEALITMAQLVEKLLFPAIPLEYAENGCPGCDMHLESGLMCCRKVAEYLSKHVDFTGTGEGFEKMTLPELIDELIDFAEWAREAYDSVEAYISKDLK